MKLATHIVMKQFYVYFLLITESKCKIFPKLIISNSIYSY